MMATAKSLADMENSTFVADAEWFEWLNRGLEDLWEMLQEAYGSEHFITTGSQAITAGTESYDLSDSISVLHSQYLHIGGQNYKLSRWELEEEPYLRNMSSALGSGSPFKYHLFQKSSSSSTAIVSEAVFLPVPTSDCTWHYRFTPRFTPLTTGQSFDGVAGYEEYAELVAVIKALNKEESDPSMFVADLNRVKQRVMRMKGRRDAARPPKVKRTRKRYGYGLDGGDGWL